MAYLALYREWRPRTFGEIVGQDHITRTLKNAVEAGRVGHAYLFCGARGTGKTTTAKVLAKAVNCTCREGAEPCGSCDSCRAITEGVSMDVVEVDAASNRGIEEVRELREKIKFAPTTGKFRVYIIDEVHMLTNEAFNALLKTLEEPPQHAVFILATTEPHKVPMTVLSRCQRFDFRRIAPADITRRLKEVAEGAGLEVEEEALNLIARAAEGSLRDALSILDQGAAFGAMKITAEDVHNILGTVRVDALERMAGYLAGGEAGPALRLAAELVEEGKDLRLFAREMAAYLRMLLLEKIAPGASAGEAWGDTAQIARTATKFTEEQLVRAVEIMAGAEQGMKFSTLPGIVLELALVKACRPGVPGDLSEFAARLSAVEEKLNSLAGRSVFLNGAGRINKIPEISTGQVRQQEERIEKSSTGPLQGENTKGENTKPRRQEEYIEKSSAGAGGGVVSREQLKKAWNDIMGAMRNERLPLYHNYLKAAPLAVKGRSLLVGFPEGEMLAKDMAELPGNKKYLESLLGRFLEGEWQVTFKFCRADASLPERRRVAREPAEDVKRRFEGEELEPDEAGDVLF